MDQTHFFLAVPLPLTIKEMLSLQVKAWKERFSFNKWVHPQDFHITLAFLGHATAQQIQDLEARIPSALAGLEPFQLQLSALGTFGKQDSPRILWVGVERSTELDRLQQAVGTACEQIGFQLDKRAFKPHITVARKWTGESSFQLQRDGVEAECWNVNQVVLYQTQLNKLPKYEEVYKFNI